MKPPYHTGDYVEYFDAVTNAYAQARVLTGRYAVSAAAWQFAVRRASDNQTVKVFEQLIHKSTSTKFLLTMPTHLIQ